MANALQFLYVIRPTRIEMLSDGATAEEEAIVSEHFAYLQDLTREGILILAGRTLNTDGKSGAFLEDPPKLSGRPTPAAEPSELADSTNLLQIGLSDLAPDTAAATPKPEANNDP